MGTNAESEYWSLARLRRHAPLIAVLVLVGLVGGAVVGALQPQTYTAEVRLAVGTGTMSDLNVPGFPTASAEMAADYSRWVNTTGISGLELPAGTSAVRASPFPDSNVIRIEASSEDKGVATRAAATVATELERAVNEVTAANDAPGLLGRAANRARSATDAELVASNLKTDLDTARDLGLPTAELRRRYLAASTEAAKARLVADGLQDRYRRLVSTATTEAELSRVGRGATVAESSRTSTATRFGLVGAGVGLVVALLLVRLRGARPSRRLAPGLR